MENTKYYTPEIKEFCIGFEYEEEVNNLNWNKMIRPPEDNYEWVKLKLNTNHSISKIIFKIKKQKIRVKYLDKTDIESFGFINILTTGTQRFKKYVNLKQLEDGEWFDYYLFLSLRYFDNTPHITIKKIDIHTYEEEIEVNDNVKTEYLFQGYVKNKHEFSKILKQLGIDGNN